MTPTDIGPVLDRMYADRTIYCIQPWCVDYGKLTLALMFIGQGGRPRVPTCCDCARNWQAAQAAPVELWYIDEDMKEHWWAAIDGAIGSPPSPPPPPAPAAPPAASEPEPEPGQTKGFLRWLTVACVSLVLGMILAIAGLPDGRSSGNTPNVFLVVLGVLLILTAIVAGIGAALQYRPAPGKQGFTAADAAWMAAGAAGVWDMHHRHEENRKQREQAQRDKTQQDILDELRRMRSPA